MSTDIEQLRAENSYRAVIGRERFVQLRHHTADARSAFKQMNLNAPLGQIEGSLYSCDPSSDDQHGMFHTRLLVCLFRRI
jgi:hypothetical protein